MLPPDCRWIDSPDGSFLHFRYACIASVMADGRVRIQGYRQTEGRAASLAQGKRHVARWIAVHGLPPGKDARRIHADRAAGLMPPAPPRLKPAATACTVQRMPEPPDEWDMLPPQRDW